MDPYKLDKNIGHLEILNAVHKHIKHRGYCKSGFSRELNSEVISLDKAMSLEICS